jgi:putative addiction module killer protein
MPVVYQTERFVEWLDGLRDRKAQVRIAARIRLVEAGVLGDWAPVQGEVSELRVHFGPGYRLYFTRRGNAVILLLCGGDKSSQSRDIRDAIKLSKEIGELP